MRSSFSKSVKALTGVIIFPTEYISTLTWNERNWLEVLPLVFPFKTFMLPKIADEDFRLKSLFSQRRLRATSNINKVFNTIRLW